MRTKSSIRQALRTNLVTAHPNWRRLVDGLLGKELIAYGTEVIYAAESIKDSLTQSLNPDTADFPGLISLSQMNDVCVSQIDPNYIRVRLASASPKVLYKPFDLVLQSGAATFTNVDYCQSGDEVVLYQGKVCNMLSSENDTSASFMDFRIDLNGDIPYKVSNFPVGADSVSRYLILGNALYNSVYYFKKYQTVTAMSLYQPFRYGPQYDLYKLKTISDGKIAIQLGDGIWGRDEFDPGTTFQVVWLELTNEEFYVEGSTIYSYQQDSNVDYLLLGYHNGNTTSLEYARAMYKQQMLKTQVVSSLGQIKDFTNGYPYIQDSSAEVLNNIVNVYVKPVDKNEVGYYGEVEADLDLYGSIFSKYTVQKGVAVKFTLIISGVESSITRSQIKALLLKEYSYENLPFDFDVDPAAVSAFIQSNFDVSTLVRVKVSMSPTSAVVFIPIEGTVRLYQSEVLIGWDNAGFLLGKGTGTALSLSWLDTYGISSNIFVKSSSNYYLYDAVSMIKRDITNALSSVFSSVSNVKFISSNGVIILQSGDEIAIFEDGTFWSLPSLLNDSLFPLVFADTGTVSLPTSNSSQDYKPLVIYKDNCIFIVAGDSSTNITVSYNHFIEESNQTVLTEYFVRQFDLRFEITAALVKGEDLYVFGVDGTVLIVSNFNAPDPDDTGVHQSVLADFDDLVGAEITVLRMSSQTLLVLVFYNNQTKIYTADGFINNGADGVIFTNLVQRMTTVDTTYYLDEAYYKFYPVIVNDSISVVYRVTSTDQTTWSFSKSYLVDNVTGVTTELSEATQSYDITQLGTVNYATGLINYSGAADTVEYEATSHKELPKNCFLVFDEEVPIIWK